MISFPLSEGTPPSLGEFWIFNWDIRAGGGVFSIFLCGMLADSNHGGDVIRALYPKVSSGDLDDWHLGPKDGPGGSDIFFQRMNLPPPDESTRRDPIKWGYWSPGRTVSELLKVWPISGILMIKHVIVLSISATLRKVIYFYLFLLCKACVRKKKNYFCWVFIFFPNGPVNQGMAGSGKSTLMHRMVVRLGSSSKVYTVAWMMCGHLQQKIPWMWLKHGWF